MQQLRKHNEIRKLHALLGSTEADPIIVAKRLSEHVALYHKCERNHPDEIEEFEAAKREEESSRKSEIFLMDMSVWNESSDPDNDIEED